MEDFEIFFSLERSNKLKSNSYDFLRNINIIRVGLRISKNMKDVFFNK